MPNPDTETNPSGQNEQTAPPTPPEQGAAGVPAVPPSNAIESTSVTFRDSRGNALPAVQVITPVNKHKVLLKPLITGFEDDEVKAAMFGTATLKVKPKRPQDRKLPGGQPSENEMRDVEIPLSGTIAARRKTMEIMVLSVDGCPQEEAINRISLMGKEDRDFLTEEINKITDPEGGEDEKKTDSKPTDAS